MKDMPEEFLELLQSVKAKRPKTVIDHIQKYGYITTEELENTYGYNHPPRAVRDVRELGIPIKTYRIKDKDGRSIAAYRFGDPSKAQYTISKAAGRTVLSKVLKQALVEKYGSKCFVYLEPMDSSTLQIDHRVPYEISGEQDERNIESFMLLSPSANRAKSWTCEHCENWEKKVAAFCMKCFWAHPEDYAHIAGRYERVISIVFTGNEIEDYYKLIAIAGEDKAQQYIKDIIHQKLQ